MSRAEMLRNTIPSAKSNKTKELQGGIEEIKKLSNMGKVKESKANEPKVDEPKTNEPKTDEPKADKPKESNDKILMPYDEEALGLTFTGDQLHTYILKCYIQRLQGEVDQVNERRNKFIDAGVSAKKYTIGNHLDKILEEYFKRKDNLL